MTSLQDRSVESAVIPITIAIIMILGACIVVLVSLLSVLHDLLTGLMRPWFFPRFLAFLSARLPSVPKYVIADQNSQRQHQHAESSSPEKRGMQGAARRPVVSE